jgi:hypothetical protein
MNFLRLIPVILSLLLLGAHFYRAGLPVLSGFCAGALLLLFMRSSWIPRLFQLLLVLGALEWLRALYFFAAMRIAFGEPWARLAMILGGVALFTGLSGLVFRSQKLADFYKGDPQ